MGRRRVVGQPFRQMDADGHFHILGQALQNIRRKVTLMLGEGALLVLEQRGDREINLVEAAFGLRCGVRNLQQFARFAWPRCH